MLFTFFLEILKKHQNTSKTTENILGKVVILISTKEVFAINKSFFINTKYMCVKNQENLFIYLATKFFMWVSKGEQKRWFVKIS